MHTQIRQLASLICNGFLSFSPLLAQSSNRDARKTVLGFLRSRKLFVFPAILESLDQLEKWKKDTEDFSARPQFRTVLGVGFAGLETDWPAVTAAVDWALAMTREALPWATVEKIAQPEAQRQVRQVTSRLEAVLRRLESCTAAATVILEQLFEGRSYRRIEIEDFRRVTAEWSEWPQQTLEAVFPVAIQKSSTFEQLSEAARHIIETERLAESLANDEAFKKVAGANARGLASDWKALTIIRDWVEEIRGLAFPASLFEWLFSGATAERLTTVDTMLATFHATVACCQSIVSRLEGYGTVGQAWLWGSDGATWTGRLERARSIQSATAPPAAAGAFPKALHPGGRAGWMVFPRKRGLDCWSVVEVSGYCFGGTFVFRSREVSDSRGCCCGGGGCKIVVVSSPRMSGRQWWATQRRVQASRAKARKSQPSAVSR